MSSILLQDDLQNLSQGKFKLSASTGFGVSFTDLNIPVNTPPISNDFATIKIINSGGEEILLSQTFKSTAFDLDGDGKIIFNIGTTIIYIRKCWFKFHPFSESIYKI